MAGILMMTFNTFAKVDLLVQAKSPHHIIGVTWAVLFQFKRSGEPRGRRP